MPIYRIAYTPWKGKLRSTAAAWWIITKNGLVSCVKFWPLAAVALSWVTVVVVAGGIFAVGKLSSGEGALADLADLAFGLVRNFAGREFAAALKSDPAANVAVIWKLLFFALLRFQIWWQLLVGVVLVPVLVTNDLRTNAHEFYMSRSVSIADYLFGKIGIAATAGCATVLAPAALCCVVGLSFTRIPGLFAHTWTIFPRLLGASFLIVIIYSIAMTGISAISRNRAATIGLWLALIFGTDIVAGAITSVGGQSWLSFARVVSFKESALILVWNILGLSGSLQPWRGSRGIDHLLDSIGQGSMWPPALGVVIAVAALCLAIAIFRTRSSPR